MNDKDRIKKLEAELLALKGKYNAPQISPLAPKGDVKALPVIQGIRFSAAAAGIKYKNRHDVMMMLCDPGSVIAGVFTRSSTRSAAVRDCQKKLRQFSVCDEPIAIVVNSGNSNAFTGSAGEASVQAICLAVSKQVKTDIGNVYTASTGVIGENLPHERIITCLDELYHGLSHTQAKAAACAIMTTDTFPKMSARCVTIEGETINIIGFAKGSGMIAPDMATMLAYIATDAKIDQPVLQALLLRLNQDTFNAITVDSDTSTSDSVMMVATGKSNVKALTKIDDPNTQLFSDALEALMLDLAHQIIRDGEGATKFLEISVTGAFDKKAAKIVAMAIANSPLVKTAVAGEDPNWGRVVMAVGKSGISVDRDRLSIWFGDILIAENGCLSSDYREEDGANYMRNSDLSIRVDLGIGHGFAKVWTCDLTHQYITINADYRS